MGVAGTIFEMHPSKFQNQYNALSFIDFQIVRGRAQKFNLSHQFLGLLTVLIILGHPVRIYAFKFPFIYCFPTFWFKDIKTDFFETEWVNITI